MTEEYGPAFRALQAENRKLRRAMRAMLEDTWYTPADVSVPLRDPLTAPAAPTPSPASERQWWDPPLSEPHGEQGQTAVDAPGRPVRSGPARLDPLDSQPVQVIADDPLYPGEPAVGSVVTDTRTRVCKRVEDGPRGWYRPGTEQLLTWDEVWTAVGGPDLQPQPGPPIVTVSVVPRIEAPMVAKPGGKLETVRQVPVLGPDGEPTGELQSVTETQEIVELVPRHSAG